MRVYALGVEALKTIVYHRLKNDQPGPGYCHFPQRYEKKFFDQITSEKHVDRFHYGVPYKKWILPSNRRNEALDCRVYNTAAFLIARPNLKARLEAILQQREIKLEEKVVQVKQERPAPIPKSIQKPPQQSIQLIPNYVQQQASYKPVAVVERW